MALPRIINLRPCPICRHAMSGPAQRKRCPTCAKGRRKDLGREALPVAAITIRDDWRERDEEVA